MNKLVEKILYLPIDIYNIPKAIKYSLSKSYYPEERNRSKLGCIVNGLGWLFRYHEPNEFYTLYGFDNKSVRQDDFMDYMHFMQQRTRRNKLYTLESQSCILRDKLLFNVYMESLGFPIPRLIGGGIISNENSIELFDAQFNSVSLVSLESKIDYFFKDLNGECASFVKHVNDYSQFQEIIKMFIKATKKFPRKFILQEAIQQHPALAQLNSSAINTLRIVTIKSNENEYKVLAAGIRIGSSKTGNVDNWAAGGIFVNVDEATGVLSPKGVYKPKFGTTAIKTENGTLFEDYVIPYFNEAKDMACKAHRYLYNIDSIGWDIAITESGPEFIEGNDNWEISLMQGASRKGLRREWCRI